MPSGWGNSATVAKLYRTAEFDSWAYREGLEWSESRLTQRYLDRSEATLEAGTGGGRIALELQRSGFTRVAAFDIVPELVEVARERDASGTIEFGVQDATQLAYPDGSFGQVVYLQQIVSFIECAEYRLKALREARRVLRPGGTAIFSFLCSESRRKTMLTAIAVAHIALLRVVYHRGVSMQLLPWLRHGGRPNWGALVDAPPYAYWYKSAEAADDLERSGFEIVAVGTAAQVREGDLARDMGSLERKTMNGMLYFVCTTGQQARGAA